jgi:DNA polymerase III delta subunit
MLALVVGKNYSNVKKEAAIIVANFLKVNKAEVEYHTAETIEPIDLKYRAEGNSLFGDKFIYVVDGMLDQYRDDLINVLDVLNLSPNLFVFCEDSINKETEKDFTNLKAKFVSIKADEKERDNPFAITDALISRDKKRMWHLYRKELEKGESPEAIVGRLAWAMKTLVLILKNPKSSATELGISPFVYSKTKSGSSKWDIVSSQKFYTDLLFGMPNGGETEYHLEKLILTM